MDTNSQKQPSMTEIASTHLSLTRLHCQTVFTTQHYSLNMFRCQLKTHTIIAKY